MNELIRENKRSARDIINKSIITQHASSRNHMKYAVSIILNSDEYIIP